MTALALPKTRLEDARKGLILNHVFFGALALRMNFREEQLGRTRTMGTDGRDVYFVPTFVQKSTDEELLFYLGHETLHCAFHHHTRRGTRDEGRWNRAADYAVNPILVDAGLPAPEGVLTNPGFAGKSAEEIYELLEDENPDDDPGGKGSSGGGSPSGSNGQEDEDNDQDGGASDPGGNPNAQASQEASGGGGEQPGAVFDAPDPEIQEAEWKIATKQAVQVAQMMGRLPGGIKVAVDEVLKPGVDWKSILRKFVQQCARDDYTWSRPNRRYVGLGVYLPENRSRALRALVVIVDSSASTEEFLSRFRAELQAIADDAQPEAVYVIMADAAVQRVDRFERGEPIRFEVEGLGGTDFRPAFAYIEKEQLDIACAIYLTDGEGIFPETPYAFPTLWVITSPRITAPWGETLTIDTATA